MNEIKTKKRKTCHDCGIEAVDDCEEYGVHIPATKIIRGKETQFLPCQECKRNPHVNAEYDLDLADNWNEAWTVDENNQAILEDCK